MQQHCKPFGQLVAQLLLVLGEFWGSTWPDGSFDVPGLLASLTLHKTDFAVITHVKELVHAQSTISRQERGPFCINGIDLIRAHHRTREHIMDINTPYSGTLLSRRTLSSEHHSVSKMKFDLTALLPLRNLGTQNASVVLNRIKVSLTEKFWQQCVMFPWLPPGM